MPASDEEPVDAGMATAEMQTTGETAGQYPGFEGEYGGEPREVAHGYKALPLWAKVLIPVTAVLLLLGFLGALVGDPEAEDGAEVVARETTSTTEPETTTTERPATTTTTAVTTTTTAPPATTAPPTTAPPPPPPPPPTTAPPRPPTQSSCHPSYQPCVPLVSDVDCAGGSGDGPGYVSGPISVVGPDEYDLDRDGDGVACE